MMAVNQGMTASRFSKAACDEIVEVALLLPANRMEALVDMSRRRRQSVGQILRGLIDQALAAEE